jgi:hypothetical protein
MTVAGMLRRIRFLSVTMKKATERRLDLEMEQGV